MGTVVVQAPADLGPALREVRVSEGVTQSALADLAGVGRQWLNSFEMGDKASAPLDMAMRVAAALGVTATLRPRTPLAQPAGSEESFDLDAHLSEFDR